MRFFWWAEATPPPPEAGPVGCWQILRIVPSHSASPACLSPIIDCWQFCPDFLFFSDLNLMKLMKIPEKKKTNKRKTTQTFEIGSDFVFWGIL